jgi:hypothetical protein
MDRKEELKHQEEIWEKRRQISGQGALDVLGRPKNEPLIVMVAGPIGWWWDENWMTPEHIRYDQWRSRIVEELVAAGHLAYLPFQAFKGTWTNRAQVVNNAIVTACDVVLDLTPYGVHSEGTETEVALAKRYGKYVLLCPPAPDGFGMTHNDDVRITTLLEYLADIALDK